MFWKRSSFLQKSFLHLSPDLLIIFWHFFFCYEFSPKDPKMARKIGLPTAGIAVKTRG